MDRTGILGEFSDLLGDENIRDISPSSRKAYDKRVKLENMKEIDEFIKNMNTGNYKLENLNFLGKLHSSISENINTILENMSNSELVRYVSKTFDNEEQIKDILNNMELILDGDDITEIYFCEFKGYKLYIGNWEERTQRFVAIDSTYEIGYKEFCGCDIISSIPKDHTLRNLAQSLFLYFQLLNSKRFFKNSKYPYMDALRTKEKIF